MEIGENWLKRLVEKFKRNFEVLDSYCKEKMRKLIISKPEAGYCIVIDFKNYRISSQEMLNIFDKAGVLAKKMDTYYEPMK
jgi:bifunctional pyridoxal-dependent enzyme with beta-cystathionase and maltose regulon repressor activities